MPEVPATQGRAGAISPCLKGVSRIPARLREYGGWRGDLNPVNAAKIKTPEFQNTGIKVLLGKGSEQHCEKRVVCLRVTHALFVNF